MNLLYCRLCLKSDCWNSPLPIFSPNSSLPSKVEDLLGISLKENDQLPQVICHLCLAKVTFLDEFNKQVKNSTNLLSSLISGRDITPQEADRHQNTLAPPTENLFTKPSLSTPKAKVIPQKIAEVRPASTSIEENSGVEKNEEAEPPELSPQLEESVKTSYKRKKLRQSSPTGKSSSNNFLKHCTRCRFSTKSDSELEFHNNNKFKCSTCKQLFCSERGLRIHEAHAHKKQRASNGNVLLASAIDNSNNNNDETDKSNCVVSDGGKMNYNLTANLEGFNNDCGYDNANGDYDIANDDDKDDPGSIYQWCQACDMVYSNREDFIKHNEEFHGSPKKYNYKTNTYSMDEIRNPSSSQLDTDVGSSISSETSRKSKVKTGHKKKELEDSGRGESESKRLKLSSGFACWKCKGVFESRPQLFVHPCIQPPGSNDDSNVIDCDSSSSSDDGGSNIGVRKKSMNRILSEEDDNNVSDKDLDAGMKYIENRVSPVEDESLEEKESCRKSRDKNSYYQKVYDDSDSNSCGAPQLSLNDDEYSNKDTKGDNSDYKKNATDNNSICNDEGNRSDHNFDTGTMKINEDCSSILKTPTTTPGWPKTGSSLKTCNECDEKFSSMKALFRHKQSHKTVANELKQ